MLFKDVIDLIPTSPGKNDIGDAVQVKGEPRQIFANRKSIRQSEFYQAAVAGFKPELMFEIRSVEYQGERLLRYCDKDYDIIRTYDKNGEITELVCQGPEV